MLSQVSRRIRSEKLKEHQYRERYTRSFEEKGIEWDGDNVKHMWERVKWAMTESAREVGKRTQRLCGGMMR